MINDAEAFVAIDSHHFVAQQSPLVQHPQDLISLEAAAAVEVALNHRWLDFIPDVDAKVAGRESNLARQAFVARDVHIKGPRLDTDVHSHCCYDIA